MMEPLCPIIREGLVTKRFVFGPDSISALRAKYGDPKMNIRPSRVEALRGFFLKRHMETTGRRKYMGVEAVNLRPRTVPPLSMRHFGNIIVILKHKMEFEAGAGERDMVRRMREAIGEVGMGCVKEIQDTREYLKAEMEAKRVAEEEGMLPIPFTSLCRFPMYEADMGWGKPAWVSTVGLPHPDMVSFWDGRDGESIEVYVTLWKEDMAKFDKDEELLAHAHLSS
ncbi:hypothetical protein MLD38_020734 [Melastoma candidum]|nr:hypothetical protein MLD38_020734 [Melastoma candidum]